MVAIGLANGAGNLVIDTACGKEFPAPHSGEFHANIAWLCRLRTKEVKGRIERSCGLIRVSSCNFGEHTSEV